MADTGTTPKPRAKRASSKPKASSNGGGGGSPAQRDGAELRQQTGYVILDRVGADAAGAESIDALRAAIGEGRVWIERPQQTRANRGDEAIKAANLRPDGSYEPGTFKAVPGSTWDALANNLGIVAEQKVVNTFVRGSAPEVAPEPPKPE